MNQISKAYTKKIRITGAQLSFSVGAIQENKSKNLNRTAEIGRAHV